MRGFYNLRPDTCCDTAERLLGMPHVTVERWETVKDAVVLHRQGLDFGDALHWVSSATHATGDVRPPAAAGAITGRDAARRIRDLRGSDAPPVRGVVPHVNSVQSSRVTARTKLSKSRSCPERPVDATAVDLQVLVHQHVPETGHRGELRRQSSGDDFLAGEQPEERLAVCRERQLPVGDDVVADVEYGLNRELQIPLGVSVDERIAHEPLLVGDVPDPAKQAQVLADLRDPGGDHEPINH
jgi:hypothetical protein